MEIKKEICVCSLTSEVNWTTGIINNKSLKGKFYLIHADDCSNQKGQWVWDIDKKGKQTNQTVRGFFSTFEGKEDQKRIEREFWDDFIPKHNLIKHEIKLNETQEDLYFINPTDVDTIKLGYCDICGQIPIWLMVRSLTGGKQFCYDCSTEKLMGYYRFDGNMRHNDKMLDINEKEKLFLTFLDEMNKKRKKYLEWSSKSKKNI